MKKNKKCVQTIFFDTRMLFFDIRGYFEVPMFEISRANCITFLVVL